MSFSGWKKGTVVVILGAVALWIGWDLLVVWLAQDPPGQDNATISRQIADWAYSWFIIPLAMGVLVGHFFWTVEPSQKVKYANLRAGALIVIGISVLAVDILTPVFIYPLIPALVGIPIGRYLWFQRSKV